MDSNQHSQNDQRGFNEIFQELSNSAILQDKIRLAIHSYPEPIFQNVGLFQAIICKENKQFNYQSFPSIYKGVFKCQNHLKCEKQWSSSLVHGQVRYITYPKYLKMFLPQFKKGRRCEIYFYVKFQGQKCSSCKYSKDYSYPRLRSSQEDRLIDNFAYYIRCKIHRKQKDYYQRPTRSRRLIKHNEKLCQACKKGKCAVNRRQDRRQVQRRSSRRHTIAQIRGPQNDRANRRTNHRISNQESHQNDRNLR